MAFSCYTPILSLNGTRIWQYICNKSQSLYPHPWICITSQFFIFFYTTMASTGIWMRRSSPVSLIVFHHNFYMRYSQKQTWPNITCLGQKQMVLKQNYMYLIYCNLTEYMQHEKRYLMYAVQLWQWRLPFNQAVFIVCFRDTTYMHLYSFDQQKHPFCCSYWTRGMNCKWTGNIEISPLCICFPLNEYVTLVPEGIRNGKEIRLFEYSHLEYDAPLCGCYFFFDRNHCFNFCTHWLLNATCIFYFGAWKLVFNVRKPCTSLNLMRMLWVHVE